MIPLPPWVIGIGALLASIGWLRSTAAAQGPPGPPDPYASQVANRHHLSEAAQAGAGGAGGDLASLLALLRGSVGATTSAQAAASDMGYSYSDAASSGADYGVPPGGTPLYEGLVAAAAARGSDVTASRKEAAAAKAGAQRQAAQVSVSPGVPMIGGAVAGYVTSAGHPY